MRVTCNKFDMCLERGRVPQALLMRLQAYNCSKLHRSIKMVKVDTNVSDQAWLGP